MPQHDHVDELAERAEWIIALLGVRAVADDSTRAAAVEVLVATTINLRERYAEGSRHELLRERLGLSETELQVVWLLAVASLDSHAIQNALARGGLTPALTLETLRRLIYGAHPSQLGQRELARDGKLRGLGLIERSDGNSRETPEARWTWALTPRLLAWLHGDDRIDPLLGHVAGAVDRIVDAHDLALSAGAIDATRKALRGASNTVVVSGSVCLGRRTLLAALAAEVGLDVIVVDCRHLERDPVMFQAQLRAFARECRLLARTPLLVNIDALTGEPNDARIEVIGRELVTFLEGPVLVTCGVQRPALRWGRPVIVIELEPPTSEQRAKVWLNALGEGSPEDARRLANIYPLAPALIHDAAIAARARAGGEPVTDDDITAGVRAILDDRVGQYAKRVTVRQSWKDLVLPEDLMDAINELIARIRQRTRVFEEWELAAKVGKGLGTSALFSGPPGTGKTMVAALVARELGLEVYQVDLAKVVSKWIGESEKNLAALFDAAEAGHAILLFDEADALFGKRTELRSSNDRYANLETNYLLQRLETFSGICILTSNHESNIDPAFQRRFSLHLRFDLPEIEERVRLWRAMLTTGTAAPLAPNLSFESLARRYELSGGSIRNAALRAAFLAADQNTAITMALLERAARLEYEGLGKIPV